MAGKSNQMSIYVPTNGAGSAMTIFRPVGMADTTETRSGGRSVVYVNGPNGEFLPFDVENTPPGDLPNTDITFFIEGKRNFFELQVETQCEFHLQKRYSPCGSLDNPTGWRLGGRIWHYPRGLAETRTVPTSPELRASGVLAEFGVHASWMTILDYLVLTLSQTDLSVDDNVVAIDGIDSGCGNAGCGSGCPAADKFIVIGMDTASGAGSAVVKFSLDGGSTFTNITAHPFDTGGLYDVEDDVISAVVVDRYEEGVVIIVSRGVTDLLSPAVVAKAVVTSCDSTTIAAATWTVYEIGDTLGEYVTAMYEAALNEIYAGLDSGDIYVSTDQGETWTRVGQTSQQVNDFVMDKDGGMWAVGASNTIYYKGKNDSAFSAKVGPNDGDFHSVNIDYNGVIMAGVSNKLYKNTNAAKTAGNWTSLKTFDTNDIVIAVKFEGIHKVENGDSELIRVFVSDTTGATSGSVFDSVDGGASFDENSIYSNTGYNAVYQKSIGNGYVIAADAGLVHLFKE